MLFAALFLFSTIAQSQTLSFQCPSYSGLMEAELIITRDKADLKVVSSLEEGEFALAAGETISLASQEPVVTGWLEFEGRSELGQAVRINLFAADLRRPSLRVALSNTGRFASSVEVNNQLDCVRK